MGRLSSAAKVLRYIARNGHARRQLEESETQVMEYQRIRLNLFMVESYLIHGVSLDSLHRDAETIASWAMRNNDVEKLRLALRVEPALANEDVLTSRGNIGFERVEAYKSPLWIALMESRNLRADPLWRECIEQGRAMNHGSLRGAFGEDGFLTPVDYARTLKRDFLIPILKSAGLN